VTQATLQTDRIRLVPLADKHLKHEVELRSDAEVIRYLAGRARTATRSSNCTHDALRRQDPCRGLGFWVGFVDGQFIGWFVARPGDVTAALGTHCWPRRGRELDQRGRAGPGERNAEAGPPPADEFMTSVR